MQLKRLTSESPSSAYGQNKGRTSAHDVVQNRVDDDPTLLVIRGDDAHTNIRTEVKAPARVEIAWPLEIDVVSTDAKGWAKKICSHDFGRKEPDPRPRVMITG